MRILLANDDGAGSAGILALAAALSAAHELTVIAPDGDRSGVSHSITHDKPIRVRRLTPTRGEKAVHAISGTPVDCVRLAVLADLMEKPELVLSGINHGENLGSDVLYSGTAAAARQAALMGIPAIALSRCRGKQPQSEEGMAAAARFVADNLEELVALVLPGTFLNVNYPNGAARGTIAAPPVDVKYSAGFKKVESSHYGTYYFPESSRDAAPPEGDDDWSLAAAGWITITRVPVIARDDPGHTELCARVQGREWRFRR